MAKDAEKPACSVRGAGVSELRVLIQPAAFVISAEGGTHDLTTVQWDGSKFNLGTWRERLGPHSVVSVDVSLEGMLLELSGGYHVHIPASRLQYTWRT